MLLYHGTGVPDVIAREGLSAHPADKSYDASEDSLESCGGAYLTDDLDEAFKYADRAVIEFSGSMGIVCVEADPADLAADEDVVRGLYRMALDGAGLAVPEAFGRSLPAARRLAERLAAGDVDPALRRFAGLLDRWMEGDGRGRDLLLALYRADIALASDDGMDEEATAALKAAWRDAVNAVSRSYPAPGRPGWRPSCGPAVSTARCLRDVGFSGRTRIVGVARIETEDRGLVFAGVRALRGRLPAGFAGAARAAFERRIAETCGPEAGAAALT